MIQALYFLFVLSGAAGLIYESIWTRYLGLFVGHGAYAQIIVLVIFLGGMSLGAVLISRRSERMSQPLYGYVAVEFAAGCVGLFFHDIFQSVTNWAYAGIYPALAGSKALVLAKWAIAGSLILPQSILLGMTFPLITAGVLRLSSRRPGRVLSMLYFSNRRTRGRLLPGESGGTAWYPAYRGDAQPAGCSRNHGRDRAGPGLRQRRNKSSGGACLYYPGPISGQPLARTAAPLDRAGNGDRLLPL